METCPSGSCEDLQWRKAKSLPSPPQTELGSFSSHGPITGPSAPQSTHKLPRVRLLATPSTNSFILQAPSEAPLGWKGHAARTEEA